MPAILDLERAAPVRLTTSPAPDIAPLWSPDGRRIVFSSRASHFDLFERSLTTAVETPLLATKEAKSATDWSPDGRFILFRSLQPEFSWDIWALPLEAPRKPLAIVRTPFDERDAQFSPDGRWIAYQSNNSGQFEVYVKPFQRQGEPLRISTTGGVQPRWRHDGGELFYLSREGDLMAVKVALGETPSAGPPTRLFAAAIGSLDDVAMRLFTPSNDGERFLVDILVEESTSPIVVILNWTAPGEG